MKDPWHFALKIVNHKQNAKDLIILVGAKRDFKENTLILNLQNKKYFMRLGDGRYTVREL